ncbi:hypothetical protein BGZ88_007707 [Linnemannia elongata]|nr:hypothetical protein BGZ88_007707 [Linnemannia elongata]
MAPEEALKVRLQEMLNQGEPHLKSAWASRLNLIKLVSVSLLALHLISSADANFDCTYINTRYTDCYWTGCGSTTAKFFTQKDEDGRVLVATTKDMPYNNVCQKEGLDPAARDLRGECCERNSYGGGCFWFWKY